MLTKNSGGALALGPATSLRVLCGSQPILAKSTGGHNISTYLKFMNIFFQAQASVQSDITVVNWLCHPPKTEVSWTDFAPKYCNKVLIYGGENVPPFVACSAV